MDWQGSYGLRPWLPWSGRWYYGDAVAIVDPFFWLVPLVALAWGSRRHWLPLALWAAVGVPITIMVLRTDQAGLGLKAVYAVLCVVAAVGWTRHWFGVDGRRRAAARAVLALAGYGLAQGIASLPAKAAARRAAIARFGSGAQWAALTVVGRPFSWEPIYASADTVAGDDWALPRHLKDPRVQDALQHTFEGRAMVQFARFLTAEVDTKPQGGGLLVFLRDARYTRVARAGWAVVVIRMAAAGGEE